MSRNTPCDTYAHMTPAPDPSPEMTPQTLWAVWSRTPEFFLAKKLETDPVRKTWVLASPGDQGLVEIAGPSGFQGSLIAALSLDMLTQITAVVERQQQTLVGKLLGRKTRICIVRKPNGEISMVPHRRKQRDDVELISGDLEDLERVVEEGKKIFETMNYSRLAGDLRPVTPDHPERWLLKRKDPAAYAVVQKFMNEMGGEW